MTGMAGAYLIYLTISLIVTVGVGRSLHRHGRPFLVEVFAGNARLADAVNHLLLVGFYLVNAAVVLFHLRSRGAVAGLVETVELLSAKFGFVLTLLGGMHFLNIAVLMTVRQEVARRTRRA